MTPSLPSWLEGLTHKDWLFDGCAIRGEHLMAAWDDLDWSKAYVDMGPSVAGNLGPYWHVPRRDGDTVHRLYPKLLKGKWLLVVRQAVKESLANQRKDMAKARRAAFDAGKRSSEVTA